MRTALLSLLALAAIIAVALTTSIERGPEFHRYADTRTWLGIPHAGDVLSNLAFVAVAFWAWRDRWRSVPWSHLVCTGVFLIGIGSGVYHVAPNDTLLAFDWAPIALTLGLLSAVVIYDRNPEAGRVALVLAPALAIGSVVWWLATGGTHGGNMAPYVATQATGIALPPLLAIVEPGTVRARWLVLGVAGFLLARLFAMYDRALLDAIAVSGHSLKHCAAAVAAACGLRALMRR